jgi:UMF1 family MFS transporter
LFTCLLATIPPGYIVLAVALYIPANFFYSIGENFLATFLPVVAPSDKLGRVSGFSWGCAYFSAILLLVFTAFIMQTQGFMAPHSWRPFFVFAGVWFLAFTVPALLWLPEPPPAKSPKAEPDKSLLSGFVALWESLVDTLRYRDLSVLLLASLLYGTAMSTVVFFAGKIAAEYGFTEVKLVLFVAVITISGVVGTLLPMAFQDKLGHRRMTLTLLTVWLFTTLSFAAYASYHARMGGAVPTWPLWVIGNLLGFGLGSLGSANRAFVGFLSPPGKEGSVFGLWGLTYKLSAVMTFPFAWVRDTTGTPASLLLLAGLVVVGIVLTLLVNEHRGRAMVEAREETVERWRP